MTKKTLLIAGGALLLIALIAGGFLRQKIYSSSVTKDTVLYVKTGTTFEELEQQLGPLLANPASFSWVAGLKKFKTPKAGKYELKKGMNNDELVNLLRSGRQTAIKVAFNNQDTLEKLAGRIATQIEADSTALITAFKDPDFLSKNNLNKATVLAIFIPNSYQFYWNTSAESFRNKMLKEYKRFWNKERLQKAKALKLSPLEVSSLAAIVHKETAKISERPVVAGLYLNRLKKNMMLQADPTLIYCLKQLHGQDYVVKRVLSKDLTIASPYNTYQNTGVPPSPIGMPDISAIDAVLNHTKHNYYYMCASIDKPGYHAFAKTLRQHNRNAIKYHKWINQQGIRR